jgi:hypothetical protein
MREDSRLDGLQIVRAQLLLHVDGQINHLDGQRDPTDRSSPAFTMTTVNESSLAIPSEPREPGTI